METLFYRILLVILTRFREPSTWIPITSLIGAYFHYNIDSPQLQATIDYIFAGIVCLLFAMIQERIGPNPENAPMPPSNTAPVVVPTSAPDVTAVVIPSETLPVSSEVKDGSAQRQAKP